MYSDFPNKYFVDKSGNYLGQFSGHIVDDADGRRMVYAHPDDPEAIEIENPPEDGRQIYDFDSGQFRPV